MTVQNHILFWSFISALFIGFVFVFEAVLLPFVLGIAVAYLLNPLVNKLGKIGLSRGPAALLILFTFLAIIVAFFAALSPILYKELIQLSEDMPGYIDRIWALLEPLAVQLSSWMGQENGVEFKALVSQHAGIGLNIARQVAENLAAGGQAAIDFITVTVFMPIVAYFMMKEWVHITNWVHELMPRDQKKTITDLLEQIDEKISGFVRGQISVAVILGIGYAIALSIIGLKYGILIGFTAGLLSIIPMVGSAIGLIVSIAVAWFQFGDWVMLLIVGGVFLAGQFIEGNILTPKLVGESVGLHPLWVFFALFAGGSLFGILGMLLAVPVAAVAGVLLAFAIAQYKLSPYFKGTKSQKKEKKTK